MVMEGYSPIGVGTAAPNMGKWPRRGQMVEIPTLPE
jgi:hypothetical protein